MLMVSKKSRTLLIFYIKNNFFNQNTKKICFLCGYYITFVILYFLYESCFLKLKNREKILRKHGKNSN